MAQPQRVKPIESADPIWARIRSEAEAIVRQEPQLASFIYASLLQYDVLTDAVVQRISDRLDHPAMTGTTIRQVFLDALAESPEIGDAFRADIVATYDRDPATTRFIEPVLYFKGFHAIQTYRLAHWLWGKHRKDFAHYLQSRASEVFQTDIHPAAKDAAPMLLQCRFGVRVLLGIGAPDDEIGAGLRQRLRHAAADTAIAAGDERHLAAEIERPIHRRPLRARSPQRYGGRSGGATERRRVALYSRRFQTCCALSRMIRRVSVHRTRSSASSGDNHAHSAASEAAQASPAVQWALKSIST